MAIHVKGHLHIEALQNILNFGPWDFYDNDVYSELFAAQIQLAPSALAQIIGGVSPSIAAITTIQYLCLIPDQVIYVGLHGVNAQTSGFTLNANRSLKIGTGSMTSLSLFNTTILTTNVIVVIGGS